MKKILVILSLISLISWGAYDLYQDKPKPLIQTETEQPNTGNTDLIVGLEQGDMAPDFILPTLKGDNLNLSDYQGKKVILNLWATWCPPCKAEMPHLQSFYEDHKKNGIEVIGVNLTEAEKNKEDVSTFIADYQLTFPVVMDEKSQVADQYQVTTIPTTYIVDTKGRIAHKIVGPMTVEMMDEIMKQVE